MNRELVLQGLFRRLVRHGFPLGVRDYVDALRALQAGYGLGDRQSLEWLCRTLWARNDHEARQLSLLFRRFPYPTPEEVAVREPEGRAGQLPERVAAQGPQRSASIPPPEGPQVGGRFVPATQSGLGLPPARVSAVEDEPFILAEQPLLPVRSLIVAWRRYREAQRIGPRVELDIEATIAEQCRQAYLEAPVLIPARRNQARLVVLLDASKSMVTWQSFYRTLVESLAHGQLGRSAAYYFDNVPQEVVYRQGTLTQPLALGDALREHPDSALLIVSDAGAARGFDNPTRVGETRAFLSQVLGEWSPVAWLNPMPAHRWPGSSAAEIARLPDVAMLELTDDGLIQAIDVLRGRRAGAEFST